jgi:phosphoglycolate phosphatase-like HAD superfamily hydrolase
MKFEQVSGLAWDLDGTLIDSFELYNSIIMDMADAKGYQLPDRQTIAQNYHGTLEESLGFVFQNHSQIDIEQLVEEFISVQSVHYEQDVDRHFFEDAVGLAHRGNDIGAKQVVVTNRAHGERLHASPRSIIERSMIAEFIHEIRCGDEVVARKPDPRSLDDWLQTHDLSPESLLVIGDQYVDALLAINLGSKAVLAARNGQIPHLEPILEEHADSVFVVNSLNEIELVKTSSPAGNT